MQPFRQRGAYKKQGLTCAGLASPALNGKVARSCCARWRKSERAGALWPDGSIEGGLAAKWLSSERNGPDDQSSDDKHTAVAPFISSCARPKKPRTTLCYEP